MIYKPSLTNDRLMLEHDESLRADLLPIHFPASYENGKLEQFFSLISRKSMKNHEQKNFCLTMFPEKRYFQETTSTTETIAKGPDTTTWIWNLHADAHDFDSHTSDLEEISRKVFSAHFGQLSIIFLWLSGMYFHGARFSNYEAWLSDPTHIGPSAQMWRASGITSELQLYCTAIGALVFAALMLFAGWFHYHKAAPKLAWFQDVESMLNHHLAGLLGLGSLAWAGHQVHVSLPNNQFLNAGVDPKEIPLPHEFILNRDLMAQLYPSFAEGATPFFTLNWSKYAEFLTFRGGLDPVTGGLRLTDIAHHHLAIAILFLIAGHMYRTNWGIGHGLKEILDAHKGPFTGQGHKGLYEILTTSWHAQLSLNLAMLGSLTIIVAHHMYSMPPYPYLATDYGTQLSLFTHHMWIGGFLIVGAAAHAAIFMVRDYDPTTRYNDLLDRVLRHRDAIISRLNWACIFLGFHSFGLYIHNDTMSALGRAVAPGAKAWVFCALEALCFLEGLYLCHIELSAQEIYDNSQEFLKDSHHICENLSYRTSNSGAQHSTILIVVRRRQSLDPPTTIVVSKPEN
nr:photosystem I P700 apoprotein A1 [Ipomoea batatas]